MAACVEHQVSPQLAAGLADGRAQAAAQQQERQQAQQQAKLQQLPFVVIMPGNEVRPPAVSALKQGRTPDYSSPFSAWLPILRRALPGEPPVSAKQSLHLRSGV